MNKQGVLLINLGSPDSPSVPDVRKYLAEFLMDERVLDTPWLIRAFVVYGMILPFRPRQSAHAYQKIWTASGSPLVATSRKVQSRLQEEMGSVPVELAMRYQKPSIESAVGALRDRGVEDLLVVPLFPHYAMSSFETAAVRAREVVATLAPGTHVRVAPPFYADVDYIRALVASAAPTLDAGYDHLLFSFHGLPERHLKKSDPTGCHCLTAHNCCDQPSPARDTCYRAQCFATVRAFVSEAGVEQCKYSIAFQSRLGRDPWLKPYTDFELERLAQSGVRKLLVICPAFVADCLETLEEIAMRGREIFIGAGGKEFELIPCMNEHPRWLEALESIVRRGLAGSA